MIFNKDFEKVEVERFQCDSSRHGIKLIVQHIEKDNGSMWDCCIDGEWFKSVADSKESSISWAIDKAEEMGYFDEQEEISKSEEDDE